MAGFRIFVTYLCILSFIFSSGFGVFAIPQVVPDSRYQTETCRHSEQVAAVDCSILEFRYFFWRR